MMPAAGRSTSKSRSGGSASSGGSGSAGGSGKRSERAKSRQGAEQNPRAKVQAPEIAASESPRWTFFTNHAHVLICLYQDSEAILRDIAGRVGITERAVQRIVQELEEAGFVERERVGRRNRYKVIRNKSLRHPIEEHCSVDELFAVILEKQSP